MHVKLDLNIAAEHVAIVQDTLVKGRLVKNNAKYTISGKIADAPKGIFEDFVRDAQDRERGLTQAKPRDLRLRQEMEQMQRGTSSRESSTTIASDDAVGNQENEISVKVEPPQRGVKREREDDGELQELMPPPKRPTPTIELDNDDEQDEVAPRGTKRVRDENDDDL
ncbi:hypothetical protein LTR70_004231 [Exophiala xenobiotica]|uniref:Uncharacterized protein n=1 Tax=Lithohypha guttulata TaxID=1690604 RepID=A0ABR0KEB0_9EURO|nr:hypothetical protein LTR24_003713 [Lithohypha guttulata]KAK5321518.1 hypothetical protein LTR70_004231 [Exophiala xenobiotica]